MNQLHSISDFMSPPESNLSHATPFKYFSFLSKMDLLINALSHPRSVTRLAKKWPLKALMPLDSSLGHCLPEGY